MKEMTKVAADLMECLNDLYIEVAKQSFDHAESQSLKEVMDKAEVILSQHSNKFGK